MAELFQDFKSQLQSAGHLFLLNSRRREDIDRDILARGLDSGSEIRTLKKGTDNPSTVTEHDFILLATDRASRHSLKKLPFSGQVELPFPLEAIQILNGHQNSMDHLSDDVGIDIEVKNRKSHFHGSLEMIGKGTGISPFFEKSVVEFDLLLNLSEVGSPPHLAEEISLKKLE